MLAARRGRQVFLDLDFTLMEMNPFTLDAAGKPFPLDMRGELDDTAAFKSGKKCARLPCCVPHPLCLLRFPLSLAVASWEGMVLPGRVRRAGRCSRLHGSKRVLLHCMQCLLNLPTLPLNDGLKA